MTHLEAFNINTFIFFICHLKLVEICAKSNSLSTSSYILLLEIYQIICLNSDLEIPRGRGHNTFHIESLFRGEDFGRIVLFDKAFDLAMGPPDEIRCPWRIVHHSRNWGLEPGRTARSHRALDENT